MTPHEAKRALASLARGRSDRARTVIARAAAATDDVERAARFANDVGVERLERAVETAREHDPVLAREGERTLTAFVRFRDAAASPAASSDASHGTNLRERDQRTDQ